MKFELPQHKKQVHELIVPLRWGDMDAMGHINNTLYFRYMESCRLDWMQPLMAGIAPAGQGPVIINAFCNFLSQLEFPGELRVTMVVANPGRSSFETYHPLERTDRPGVTVAEGGARVVWTDQAARKSAPLPEALRRLLE